MVDLDGECPKGMDIRLFESLKNICDCFRFLGVTQEEWDDAWAEDADDALEGE